MSQKSRGFMTKQKLEDFKKFLAAETKRIAQLSQEDAESELMRIGFVKMARKRRAKFKG
jgi:hypothetical protein